MAGKFRHTAQVRAKAANSRSGCLDLSSLKPSTACTPTLPAPNLEKLRILVVDDNRNAAESIALLLKIEGHSVETACDGPAALEIARTEPLDTILLNIGLPGMDGYMLAQELQRSDELKQTLLVAMTGYGRPEDREKSRAAGFNEHLVKPINYETLRKLLDNFLAEKCKPLKIGNL